MPEVNVNFEHWVCVIELTTLRRASETSVRERNPSERIIVRWMVGVRVAVPGTLARCDRR